MERKLKNISEINLKIDREINVYFQYTPSKTSIKNKVKGNKCLHIEKYPNTRWRLRNNRIRFNNLNNENNNKGKEKNNAINNNKSKFRCYKCNNKKKS